MAKGNSNRSTRSKGAIKSVSYDKKFKEKLVKLVLNGKESIGVLARRTLFYLTHLKSGSRGLKKTVR
jgi:hypothetical protein